MPERALALALHRLTYLHPRPLYASYNFSIKSRAAAQRKKTMSSFTFRTLLPIALLWAAIGLAQAEERQAPTLSLSAEGSTHVANELAIASMYFEASDEDPATLSRKVNKVISDALATARTQDTVKIQSDGMNTYPVHARNDDGRQEITAWRMRADLRLESEDLAAMSELIGQLQQEYQLNIAGLSLQPTRQAREDAADEAARAAVKAFERRAGMLSEALGKDYELKEMNVHFSGGQPPVRPMARSLMMTAEDAAAPIEAGETEVTVRIDGTIRLLGNE